MKAKEVYGLGDKRFQTFAVQGVMPSLRFLNEGAINDVLNTNGCRYYQWTSCLIDVLKPLQIVELGGAMGVWDLMVLHTLPADSRLYSITLAENGLEFSYIREKYNNFYPVVGDDLDLSLWPKDLDLSKTDLWFMDTIHEELQLRRELDKYQRFFKEGSIILFDDIHLNEGMDKVWNDIYWDKKDCTDPLHWSGFGLACI